jgi:hypothetical protein
MPKTTAHDASPARNAECVCVLGLAVSSCVAAHRTIEACPPENTSYLDARQKTRRLAYGQVQPRRYLEAPRKGTSSATSLTIARWRAAACRGALAHRTGRRVSGIADSFACEMPGTVSSTAWAAPKPRRRVTITRQPPARCIADKVKPQGRLPSPTSHRLVPWLTTMTAEWQTNTRLLHV